MIISHKHKFIFVKGAKIAGTSLEAALRPYLGSFDISTPVVSYDEEYMKKNNIPPPQNYSNIYGYITSRWDGRGIFAEHSWAYEIRGMIGEKIWNDYFTFTIERLPHEKTVSNYCHYKTLFNNKTIPFLYLIRFYLNKIRNSGNITKMSPVSIVKFLTFKQWVEADIFAAYSQNFLRYTINNKVIVNKVYNHKNLKLLISDLEKRIGGKLKMPRLKSQFRRDMDLRYNNKDLERKLRKNIIFNKEYDLLENL